MATAIDLHVGKRLRRRRKLLGLTQQQLGEMAGVRFQHIQKFETAGIRLTSEKLYLFAQVLNVPISYFFEGLQTPEGGSASLPEELLAQEETIELVRVYFGLNERSRKRLLELAKTLGEES